MSVNWEAVYQKLYGQPFDQTEEPEWVKMTNKVVDAFHDVVLAQAKPFVRQVAIETDKAGVPMDYLQYVFFILMEHHASWPPMPKRLSTALGLGRDIMVAGGMLPPYRAGLAVPPGEVEDSINLALQKLAEWCGLHLALAIIKGYGGLMKKYSPAIRRIQPKTPEGFEDTVLDALVGNALADRPQTYTNGHLLYAVKLAFLP